MDLHLNGKIALVTGSTAGIGLATAVQFAREGAQVVLCGRDRDRLAAAAAAMPEAAAPTAIACDVLTEAGAQELISEVERRHGGLDILVNNVGGAVGGRLLANSTDDDWRQTFEMNVVQTARLMRLATPLMAGRPGAAIVNVASMSGWSPQMSSSGQYGGAKAALIHDTERWALELAEGGVRVTTVSPGAMQVEGRGWDAYRNHDPEGYAAYLREALPMGRLGRPKEVADVIVFLASPRANWINGRMVPVDGLQQPVRLARLWTGSH